MEGEDRDKEARIQVRPEIHGLQQNQSIDHNMQYNHQPESDRRRRFSLEDLPELYNMSCTQLLALANDRVGTSSSLCGSSLIPQSSMDSWINSWKIESNPWMLNPGSSLGINNTGIAAETTIEKPQYNDVSTSKKFIYDLNLTPEEMMSNSSQPTKPEVSPITLETPGKILPETDQEPHQTIKKKRKRERDDDYKAPLKTPKQTLKRKKVRAKVVREGKINRSSSKSGVKKSSAAATATATDTKTSEAVRPKRSTRRSLRYDYDLQEEDEYCGITLASEELPDSTWRIFFNIPKRRRTNGMMRKEIIYPSSEPSNDCLSSTLSLVNTGPTTLMEPEENLPSDSHISQCLGGINDHKKLRRKKSSTVTQSRNFPVPQLKAIVSEMQSKVSRNKRSKRDAIASQLNSRVLQLQWQHQNSTGASSAELWERSISIDAITKLFKEQDINRESPYLTQSRETAVMLHKKAYQEQKALVPHKKDGSVMPYPNAKNFQSKVKVDDETKRVWKLLMVSSQSEGIDGSDEEKKQWWSDERKLFQDRANSFIARMRLVQGNRKFSPWKGSVVDSVVGVFLTQCVTDHASSSVFMNLAAEFPVNEGSCHAEWGSSVTHEVCYPESIIIQEIDDDDEIDAVCSQEASKASEVSISSTNQLKLMLLDPPTNSFETYFGSEASDKVKGDEEEILVQPMCSHQQELKSTFLAPYQVKKTRTKQPIKKKGKKPTTSKRKPAKKEPKESFDWDSLRRQTEIGGKKRERTERTMDTVDWDAIRCTNVNKIADIIRKRGIHIMLSGRIKAFLNRLVQDHGSIDLEWLRDVLPDQAKEYLLSINGLGLKSVECVRLLSLHQVAFPVDTNVGRIAVRLGWVPIQPLPDELQMHLLELYPVLNSVQEYLWPRLCKLDQKTLYELHYHMITFGKVFCTKDKPNCNACPMKAECRHYSSSRASARLALPEPEEKTTVVIHERRRKNVVVKFQESLFLYQEAQRSQNCEPIIEEPDSPEPEYIEHDIEDYPWDTEHGTSKDPWENKDVIPTIMLKKGSGTSKDLVVVSSQEASMPRPKLKTTEKLRTEHLVYELPDDHPILLGFERRETEDSVPYLLAIWTPGETINSIQPPEQRCGSQDSNTLCHDKKCFLCNCIREEKSQTVRGTILIPCRTAMRGGFPLNGTYFQINEVFADHDSSINPIQVPIYLIRNLPLSITYFGSSVSVICRGLSVEAIQFNFRRGYVCVRGFDRKKRTSETLVKRLHCTAAKQKEEDDE
ncbi:DEMETER-like protein 2 [Cardamine amara subsp. amara]|uniref:DEMETER-like protein 2 n=1 Tax=Cardamine amara subsp. amara TaxID=228776 RepID=A0ABD0ZRJ6_CARAN